MRKWLSACLWLAAGMALPAGAERDEDFLQLSARVALDSQWADLGPDGELLSSAVYRAWAADQGRTLLHVIPSDSPLRSKMFRDDFLATVFYEAHRAGLDPDWVLAIIQVESAFRKYAISPVSARGYMQVMPFWVGIIGEERHNLFQVRTNLRYGTVILRHYLDIEKGSVYRALGRYNGSLGAAKYPNQVRVAYEKNWRR